MSSDLPIRKGVTLLHAQPGLVDAVGGEAVVSVGAGAEVCFGVGPARPCRGWGSEPWGRRHTLDSTVLNDAGATQGHDHQLKTRANGNQATTTVRDARGGAINTVRLRD